MSRDPSTRIETDVNRVIPLTGTDFMRRLVASEGLLFDYEWHTTSDQGRDFFNNVFQGPKVRHDPVATEAAMLALNATSTRGCWPGDVVRRTDRGTKWECLTNNGEDFSDWEEDAPDDGAEGFNLEPVCEDGEILFDSTEDDEDGDILMEEAET